MQDSPEEEMSVEPIETFVFLPYPKYKALDNRAKKVDELEESTLPLPQQKKDMPVNPPTSKPEKAEEAKTQQSKNLTKSYRVVQIEKLLHQIEKAKGSLEVTSFPNLEELIQGALTNTRKKLPNEEPFFTFLFNNGMGHFVKNRSKIDLYYKDGLWYKV